MHQINHLNSEQKKWVVINGESWGTCSTNNQIKFKTTILKSRFCDYSDAYILVKGTTAVQNTAAAGVNESNANKKVLFKNCASLINKGK